jgi:hypothetical protein
MKTRTLLLTVSLFGILLWGCGKDEDPAAYAKKQSKDQAKPRPPSQIVKIETPVAPGGKVKCEDWIDLAKFTMGLEQELDVVLEDQSKNEADPTSICSIRMGGEPPSAEEQAKTFEKENYKIGVVGGDELCLAHLYCGYVATVEDMQRKCEADAMSDMTDLMGQRACVHRTQRAAMWAYMYNVIDSDTGCGLEVQGGPSITDEDFVQRCTLATLESLTKAGIANPYMP